MNGSVGTQPLSCNIKDRRNTMINQGQFCERSFEFAKKIDGHPVDTDKIQLPPSRHFKYLQNHSLVKVKRSNLNSPNKLTIQNRDEKSEVLPSLV